MYSYGFYQCHVASGDIARVLGEKTWRAWRYAVGEAEIIEKRNSSSDIGPDTCDTGLMFLW